MRDYWWLVSIAVFSVTERKEEWGLLLVRGGCNAQVGIFKTPKVMEGEGMVSIDLGVHMHLPLQV